MRRTEGTEQVPAVAVFTVATGRYLGFWRDLLMDADRWLFPGSPLEVNVFTESRDQAMEACNEVSSRISIRVHAIPALGWPEATLQRYELISSALADTDAAVCMHLDADLRIVRGVGPGLDPSEWASGMALVAHPGYWRGGPPRSPADAWARAGVRARNGGRMGTWENRSGSAAYVPWRARRTYVCGGVWMGRTEPFRAMVDDLAERTRTDRQQGIVPVWHDESYLNWFASTHRTTILDPSYCMALEYSWLQGLDPRIVAVDKGGWARN